MCFCGVIKSLTFNTQVFWLFIVNFCSNNVTKKTLMAKNFTSWQQYIISEGISVFGRKVYCIYINKTFQKIVWKISRYMHQNHWLIKLLVIKRNYADVVNLAHSFGHLTNDRISKYFVFKISHPWNQISWETRITATKNSISVSHSSRNCNLIKNSHLT